MPTAITGTDSFNKTQNAPAAADPGVATDIQAIVQRCLNNDYWAASRLATRALLVSETRTQVTDVSSAWGTIDTHNTTSWANASTFAQTISSLTSGDLIVARFQGTLETTEVNGEYGECRIDIAAADYSPHQRIVNPETSGTRDGSISLVAYHVAAGSSVDIVPQLRTSNSGIARLIGSGQIITAVYRPVPDPGL